MWFRMSKVIQQRNKSTKNRRIWFYGLVSWNIDPFACQCNRFNLPDRNNLFCSGCRWSYWGIQDHWWKSKHARGLACFFLDHIRLLGSQEFNRRMLLPWTCFQPALLSRPASAKATPAPPVGPAVGAFGLNIVFFVKEWTRIKLDPKHRVPKMFDISLQLAGGQSICFEECNALTADKVHRTLQSLAERLTWQIN